jgi:hypothetical protein
MMKTRQEFICDAAVQLMASIIVERATLDAPDAGYDVGEAELAVSLACHLADELGNEGITWAGDE